MATPARNTGKRTATKSKSRANLISNTQQHISPFMGIHHAVNEAMKDFYSIFETPESNFSMEHRNLYPALDIVDTGNNYTINLEMPGMDENDIELLISENILTIKGEKTATKELKDKNFLNREIKSGSYERMIELPSIANMDKACASFKNGILNIKIPKRSIDKSGIKKLKINS